MSAEGASGLREAVEALADEWESTVYTLPPGYPVTVNGFCRIWFKAPLRALLAAHPPEPEASEVVEWGVRDDRSGHTATAMSRRTADEWLAFLAADHPNEPATLMRRTRTTYADRVTEWEEVDG